MIFTAASFTVTVIGTAISVLGFISQVEDEGSRYVRAGWFMLLILGIAYVAGMVAILAPNYPLLVFVPQHSALIAALLVGVGIVGTFASAILARRWRRVPPAGRTGRWVAWGRLGLILIPLFTMLALILWL